jgi:hypothetical protein
LSRERGRLSKPGDAEPQPRASLPP